MAPIISTIDIDRPLRVVFDYVTDPSRFPEWQLDVVTVTVDRSGPHGVGTRFTTTRRIGRMERTMTQEVIEVDDQRRWAARSVVGPLSLRAMTRFEPLDDGARTRVTLSLDFSAPGLAGLLAPVIRRMAAKQAPRSCRNLKQRLESGRHPGDGGGA